MKQTRDMMGMPITVEIVDSNAKSINEVFDYFRWVDETFSTYKDSSEISRINRGELTAGRASKEVQDVLALSEKTKRETNGYFDISREGKLDPSGLVKGWAIKNAADILSKSGHKNFFVEAGGDIQVSGKNAQREKWTVGIRNPFQLDEIVKVLTIENQGVATSGTYERGKHIYNPKDAFRAADEIASMTVIGPNIYEVDRFATAAFAMGKKGIEFIENLDGFEGYMIDKNGIATMTSGLKTYVLSS